MVRGFDHLHSGRLVCVRGPGTAVLYLRGHAARERPLVFQHQGKSPSLFIPSSADVTHEAAALCNVQEINTVQRS